MTKKNDGVDDDGRDRGDVTLQAESLPDRTVRRWARVPTWVRHCVGRGPAERDDDDERAPASEPGEPTAFSHNEFDTTEHGCAPAQTERISRGTRAACVGACVLVALLTGAAAYAKYQDASAREASRAAVESVQAAKDSTTAMLSYTPDAVEQKLTAASDRLIGTFRDSYTALVHDVVIPGAKEQQISATATVAAAASESASTGHAVVLLFVNQAIIVGKDPPTQTASVVEVTLDKRGNRWLISGFEPK